MRDFAERTIARWLEGDGPIRATRREVDAVGRHFSHLGMSPYPVEDGMVAFFEDRPIEIVEADRPDARDGGSLRDAITRGTQGLKDGKGSATLGRFFMMRMAQTTKDGYSQAIFRELKKLGAPIVGDDRLSPDPGFVWTWGEESGGLSTTYGWERKDPTRADADYAADYDRIREVQDERFRSLMDAAPSLTSERFELTLRESGRLPEDVTIPGSPDHDKAARDSINEVAADSFWWRRSTPDVIHAALVASPQSAWPAIWRALDAMREDGRETA